MAAPTAAALLERLRALYETKEGQKLSDEKLAARLPIGLSTFNRWKTGDTRAYRNVVVLLEEAGWLRTDGEALATVERAMSPDDLREEIGATLRDLAEGQAEILRRLPPGDEDEQRATRPKRS